MNQNVHQLARQLLDIWRQLGLNQRISIVLAGAVVVAGLLGVAFWSSRVNYALLYGRLDDSESARVIAALEEAKIPYQISKGGGSVLVPTDKVHQVRMQLAAKGVPRGEGVGFEIFDKPNFGISDFVQRANYLRAVQGELGRTIGQLDEIEAARVMIVIPENRLLVDNKKKPTASVFIRVRGNGRLPESAVNSIRFLVANAVEGLQAGSVTVVDNQGNVLSENHEGDSLVGLSNTQLAARRNLEQYLARKAEDMLEKVLGSGQAVVRVAADINWDTITRVEEKFDPEGQVLRSATIDDENTDTNSGDSNGGVAGTASNTTQTNTAAGSVTSSTTRKKTSNNQYELSKSTSNILQAAGGIRRLSAAVFIAAKSEGGGAARKAVQRSPDELQKLRRIVQSALGIVETGDPARKDEITLEEMPFNDQPALELTQQLDKQQSWQLWWEVGKTALFGLGAVVVLFAFFRMVKRTPVADLAAGIPVGNAASGSPATGGGRPGRSPVIAGGSDDNAPEPGVVTADVLNRLIRENPQNMTQAVRLWLAADRKQN